MKNFIRYNSPYWNHKRDKAMSLAFRKITPIFNPATEKQRSYLQKLGYTDYHVSYLSKDKAMELISELRSRQPS